MITALRRVQGNAARIRNISLFLAALGLTFASTAAGAGSKSWREANASTGSGHTFSGMASYYGNESGSRTASGARFNQNAMTAAHKTLPFGTFVRVTNRANDRSVVVRINDRGPFVHGRIIDLSYAAAKAIGATTSGVITVEVLVIDRARGASIHAAQKRLIEEIGHRRLDAGVAVGRWLHGCECMPRWACDPGGGGLYIP